MTRNYWSPFNRTLRFLNVARLIMWGLSAILVLVVFTEYSADNGLLLVSAILISICGHFVIWRKKRRVMKTISRHLKLLKDLDVTMREMLNRFQTELDVFPANIVMQISVKFIFLIMQYQKALPMDTKGEETLINSYLQTLNSLPTELRSEEAKAIAVKIRQLKADLNTIIANAPYEGV